MNKLFQTYMRSVLAGMFIGIACMVSVQANFPAVMFSVGLICIVKCNLLLFTGLIGHSKLKDTTKLIVVLSGNFTGILFTISFVRAFDCIPFEAIINYKENLSVTQLFITSYICGILMCVATSLNPDRNLIVLIFCITAFVLGHFSHCIADMFYLGLNGYSLQDIGRIFIAIIGNEIGAKFTYMVVNLCKEDSN